MGHGSLKEIIQAHPEFIEKVKALRGRVELEFQVLLSFPKD